jgi:predicted metal-dependent hydrolase
LILFLGKEYPVHLAECDGVSVENGRIVLPADETRRREVLVNWYQREAASRLPAIAEKWKSFTGMEWRKLSVGNAVSRWGSCNGRNDIRLSWRLILLPEELIDYVVVHELCHTLQHNHSPVFWSEVERFLPQSRSMRKRLREIERKYLCQMNWLNSV